MKLPVPASPAALAVLAALALAGCGGAGERALEVNQLPLVAGARIALSERRCNPGADAACAYDLVVVDPGLRSSQELLHAERLALHARGWTSAYAPNGDEHAVDSPRGRLHLVYATAGDDLLGLDQGWIQRPRPVAVALSRSIFTHVPTLSMQLELGSYG
jgi:hypothetical protein